MGGAEIRMCTSAAPGSRSICTIWRVVLPRTIESSTTTTLLARLDERARDVAVLDEPVVLGQTRGARETARGGVAGVGHGDHEIGVHGRLAPEDLAHAPARDLQRVPVHARVRAGEVDVLEHAERSPLSR